VTDQRREKNRPLSPSPAIDLAATQCAGVTYRPNILQLPPHHQQQQQQQQHQCGGGGGGGG